MKKDIIEKQNQKPAFIDQMAMWMVIFLAFVWLFFFVLDYAKLLRVKDNMDAIADYTANVIGKEGSASSVISDIVDEINSDIKLSMINTLTTTSIICNDLTDNAYKVIIDVKTTNNISSMMYKDTISTKRVVFNQSTTVGDSIDCTMNISLSN